MLSAGHPRVLVPPDVLGAQAATAELLALVQLGHLSANDAATLVGFPAPAARRARES